jgi:glyoxylase-like metal-dependent hydrolase (beta-lactamase superfamily II)
MLDADVVEGVHRIEDAYTNWYLIEHEGRLTVVDTGVPTSWASLLSAPRSLGRSTGDVEAVVLPHGHFDHLGFAERARRELGVPVWIHENDVPLTRNRAWWPRPVSEVRRYQEGTLPVPGAPRVVPTPGHTLGHCALHLPDRDVVIAGDAIVTLNPFTARRGPQIVAGAATVDSRRALDSLDELAKTEARTVLVGHGDPWTGGAELAVAAARAAGAS